MENNEQKKYNLSYSAYQKYHQCPHKHHLHYGEKIRAEYDSSPRVFGGGVDKSMNVYLATFNKHLAMVAGMKEFARIFRERVVFDGDEFDEDLITTEEMPRLFHRLRRLGWKGESPKSLAETLFQKHDRTINQTRALLFLIHFSWTAKLLLMLNAFEDYIQPRIEEITAIQGEVKRGIFDFKAKLRDIEGEFVFDIKTSKYPYLPDSAEKSVQMAGYGAEKAGYIVFPKQPTKNRVKICSKCGNNGTGKRHKSCDAIIEGVRCEGDWNETVSPEIVPQFILGNISPELRDMVESEYQKTEQLIEAKVFPRDLTNCGKQFGKPCEYIGLCWNGDMTGLTKKHEKKPSKQSDSDDT